MKTEQLIKTLSADSALRWSLSRSLLLGVAGSVVAVAALFFAITGFRPDIAIALGTSRFIFKIVLTSLLAATALGLTLRLARPATEPGAWRWAVLAVPLLLLGALLLEMSVMPQSTWMVRLVGRNWMHCLTLIPLLAFGPLICLLLALRQGAPSRPGLCGAVAGVAASGIAALFYATNCTDDSPLFVAVWYPLATAIVAGAGYVLGRKLLRW